MNRPKITNGIVALTEPLTAQAERRLRDRLARLSDDALKAQLQKIAAARPFEVWDLGLTQEDLDEVDYSR
jgi:hypothetical protein